MKSNRGGYAFSTTRHWELDRSTELYHNVWLFVFGMIPVISGFLNAC